MEGTVCLIRRLVYAEETPLGILLASSGSGDDFSTFRKQRTPTEWSGFFILCGPSDSPGIASADSELLQQGLGLLRATGAGLLQFGEALFEKLAFLGIVFFD